MDKNIIKSEIEQGIAQVDSTLSITEFDCEYNQETRSLRVSFTAKSKNETVVVSNIWN